MEFLLELLLELIIEGSISLSTNKKVSKIIRYPLIILIILFFSAILIGLLWLGILIWKSNHYASLFIIIVDIILIISFFYRFKKIYQEYQEKNAK